MAITTDLIGTPQAGASASPTVSFAGTVGSGNGAVLFLKSGNRGATSVVDDQGNAFTKVRENNFFGVNYAAIWMSADSSGATAVTITFSASTSFAAQAVAVVGNLTTNAFNGTSGNNVTQQPGAITTSDANTIVFAMTNTSNAPTTPAGFTTAYADGSVNFGYEILTSTATINPAFTVSPSSPFACVQAAFASSNSAGVANAHLSDLVLWSDVYVAEKQDVLHWTDAFTFQEPVPVDVSLADTLTWSVVFGDEQNLRDIITWEVSQFPLIESYGPLADTVTWSDEFGPDINLLGFARYRR